MSWSGSKTLAACAVLPAFPAGAVCAADLQVVSVNPPAHTLTALRGTTITVEFDQPVDPASIDANSFWGFARWSGTIHGTYSFSNGNATVTLTPSHDLFMGEQAMVILSHDIQTPGGDTLRAAGYSWQFWTAAAQANRTFSHLDTLSTNAGAESSRPYGGIATDMNNDGWADLTVVNEDTADLRVFLNLADGAGNYGAFLQPTFPVNQQASPSEPADFDRDGNADIVVANQVADSVSVLLGNGDGTLAPQQEIAVGDHPRGVAVLDADGDGDLDIVNTNDGSSLMSILFNDGLGVFGAPVFFEGGGVSERALAAADMNDDGILDLVAGFIDSQTVVVIAGNGDGTFTPGTPQSAGGSVWMLVCGDVDGNGTEDVATANSGTNNGAILRGDGNGNLAAPATYPTDPFPLATDLGDLDGDGDLDWVTASFSGDWFVFANGGLGIFAFDQEINAPIAASCSLAADIDNDGDLDLALVDEIADTVDLKINDGTTPAGDADGDGSVGIGDFLLVLGTWGDCADPCPPFCAADVNFDCEVGIIDFLLVLGNWSP